MTAKKRTNQLQRTTTDATKAKLPRPRKPRKKKSVADIVVEMDTKYRPVPCMDWPADSLPSGTIPPNTEPYPWPIRLFNWCDDRVEAAQWWLATRLERLAKWVAPL